MRAETMGNLKGVFSALVISLLAIIFAYTCASLLYHLNFLKIIGMLSIILISYKVMVMLLVGVALLVPLILKIYYYIRKKECIEPGNYRLEDIIEDEN